MNRKVLSGYMSGLVTVLFAVVSPLAFGQPCETHTTFRAVDKNNNVISDVTAKELKVEVGGHSAQVMSVSLDKKPAILVLLDVSGSTKEFWKQSVDIAQQLIDDAQNGVALLVFRDKVLAYGRGAAEGKKLLDQVSANTAQGGTALYDTLGFAWDKVKDPNVAFVVISDGEDDESRSSADQVIAQMQASPGPSVFGLLLLGGSYPSHKQGFIKIAKASGGTATFANSATT